MEALELGAIVVGWLLAGLGWSLWWSERELRRSLERVFGVSLDRAPSSEQPPEPVERVPVDDVDIVSEYEIAELTNHLHEIAAAEGLDLDPALLREEAENMVKMANLEAHP